MKMPAKTEDLETFKYAVSIFAQVFMVLGGAIPYIPQYMEIAETGNTSGFSNFTAMTIVVSSLLRISYWFHKPFDTALFVQSIFMVFVMFVMQELCLRMDRKRGRIRAEHAFLELEPSYFWSWTDLLSYVEASLFILTTSVFIVLFFGHINGVIDAIAYLAMMIEAVLAAPIFVNNYRNKTTYGLNKAMVCMWGLGDIFRLTYFIIRDVPISFIICSYIQITLDILILCQIFIYGDHPKND